jgi:transcriptional regulator with XRE-family HTH domain
MPQTSLPQALLTLRDVLSARDSHWTQAELAQALGVTQQAVSRWFCGASRPSAAAMREIERLYGVPMHAWFEMAQPSERRRAHAAEREVAS